MNIEYYIELKGKQVEHACEQLRVTIEQLTKNKNDKKYSFIVSTACPLTTTEVQIYKAFFKKKYNCVLQVKSNVCQHPIL